MKRIIINSFLLLIVGLLALGSAIAANNTIASSTMVFKGALTAGGGGVYTGTIDMIPGSVYTDPYCSPPGGFDLYAKQGGVAYVEGYYGTGAWNHLGQTDTYVIGYYAGNNNDAYPTPGGPWGTFYDPDCADYCNYELVLTSTKWYLRYKGSAQATPMSGIMDWAEMYASENDIGAYVNPPADPDANDGGGAANGGGPGAWDMDWTWGSDVVPLELPGFDVTITGPVSGEYTVTLTPAAPGTVWVDDDYDSSTPGWGVTHFDNIQDAVDAVTGSTVHVAGGSYYEDVTIDLAGLQLLADTDPYGPDPAHLFGRIRIQEDGVTIKKMKITNTGGSGEQEAIFIGDASGYTDDPGAFIFIEENLIDGVATSATDKSIEGIHIKTYGSDVIDGVWIINNTIKNVNQPGRGADGIMVQANVKNVNIHDNVIELIHGYWAHGIEITPSHLEGGVPMNIEIKENFIRDITSAPNNDWNDCVSVDEYNSSKTADASQVLIKHNCMLPGDGYCVVNKDNDGNNILDASHNWFGSNDINFITSKIAALYTTNTIDYSPWLDACIDINPVIGFQPDRKILWVDYNSPKAAGNPSSRIQEGIDGVSNSTVYILGNVNFYYGNLKFTQNITLIGVKHNGYDVMLRAFNPPLIESQSLINSNVINCRIYAPIFGNNNIGYIGGASGFKGHVWFTDCTFLDENSNLITDCEDLKGYMLDGFDGTPPTYGPGKFFWNVPSCNPYDGDLLLWLDPTGIAQPKYYPVPLWPDNTPWKENATMGIVERQPTYSVTNGECIEGFPSVRFACDYGQTKYGFSDAMEGPERAAIQPPIYEYLTADNTERWTFDYEPKDRSVFAVFQVPQMMGMDDYENPTPYYSTDGRQVVFEWGGPLSGGNIYLQDGRVCMGFWNRYQQRFLLLDPTGSNLYPLLPDAVYCAMLEYDSENNRFRGSVSSALYNNASETGTETMTHTSDWIDFHGFTVDVNFLERYGYYDRYGVGAARRTRFHDYSTGETYSDHFNGKIADVMMYKEFFTPAQYQDIYDFLNDRYNSFPMSGGFKYDPDVLDKQAWKVFRFDDVQPGQAQVSEAYPNPFSTTATIGINMPAAGRVTVELFDAAGTKVADVFNGSLPQGFSPVDIHGAALPNGAYFFRVSGENFSEAGKVVLSR